MEPQEAPGGPAADRLAPLGLGLAVFVLLAAISPWTTLWDRDEPRFAGAAVAMVRSGDLLVPTFGGELRAQKPVLVTWLMAASITILGPTELAVRLPSAAGLGAACGLLAWLGGRLFSRRAGLLAGVLLATSPLALLEGLAATTDAVLLAFVTLAIALVAGGLEAGFGPLRTAALGLALGGALLTKGPVGLAVPALVALGTSCAPGASPRDRHAVLRPLLAASLLGLLLLAAWLVPANGATGGRLLELGLGREVVGRSLRPMEGHGGPFLLSLPYYLPVLALGFAPWTIFLPAAGLLVARERRTPAGRLLAAWTLAPLALFTLVATKLPHYGLPCLPPLALAAGTLLDRALSGSLEPDVERRLRDGTGAAAALLWVALLAGLGAAIWLAPHPALRPPLVVVAALAATGRPLLAARRRAGRWRAAIGLLLAGTLSAELVTTLWLAPAAEGLKPVPAVAAAVRRAVPAEAPVASLGFGEPSLLFYTGRIRVADLAGPEEAAAWARRREPGALVATEPQLALLLARAGPLPLREVARASGVNVASGKRVTLVALVRTP